MSYVRESPWAKHYQHVWEERAGDPRLPNWLRVASLAFAKHGRNGHAPFGAGQVALVLGMIDPETGQIRPSQNVTREIGTAVRYGWLAKGSKTRCLIVPSHAVAGGLGSSVQLCPVHGH